MYPPINSILILTADMTSILSMILATRVSEYSVIRKSESVSWRFDLQLSLAGSKLVDLFLQVVDFLACVF